MQKMRFFRRCLPLFLAFWLLLAVAGAPFAAYAGESVTVRDSSGQVRYAAPMDPENACPALQSALNVHILITGTQKRAALEAATGANPIDAPISAFLRNATVHYAD